MGRSCATMALVFGSLRSRSRAPRNVARVASFGAALTLLVGCTSTPSSPAPTQSSTASADPIGTTGMPEGAGITIPGIVVEQSVNNDPALQVSISRPVVPGQVPLTEALRFFTEGKERAFRADYQPSPEVGPELNITWEVATAAGSFAAIRVQTREFGGASGEVSHSVFYGNSASGTAFQSEGLIDPVHRDALAALVWTAASKLAPPIEDTAPRGALGQMLLTDLTFTPTGDMVAHLNQGAVAAYSAGNLTVTIPKDRVNPLLSVEGRAVLDAVTKSIPYAVQGSSPAQASPPAPAPDPAPAPAPPAAGGVDCAALKCVALTFDDGPGAHTSRLLTSLDAAGVKATFFVLGQNVAVNPAVIKRMAASGHVVANHTWDHRDLKKLSGADITSEVTRTNQAITAATGSGTTLLRPPYGSFGQPVRGLGQAIIMWDIDTLDWKFRNVDEVITRGMTGVKAGSIILMHDIHATTVDAVPGLIAKLKAAGFTLVTVPQLLGSPTPGTVYYSQSRTG